MNTYNDLPIQSLDEWQNLIAYAVIRIGDDVIQLSDSPGIPVQVGDNVTISVITDIENEANRIFKALQNVGNVVAPMESTPFSTAFGTVKDKFGVTFYNRGRTDQTIRLLHMIRADLLARSFIST